MTKSSGNISNRRNDSAARPSQAREIGRSIEGAWRVAAHAIALAALLLVSLPLLAQSPSEVLHRDDFQSYGTQQNPSGWVDTAIGKPGPVADGLYKTWPDPTQGNKAPNVVYGTKSASGKPEGRNPRIGTFSTLTTKEFDARGRFEFSGRLIRTRDDGRIGVTFLSQYPNADKYYLLGLWSQPTSSKLTMQLFAFDKSLEDPANPLGDQSVRLKGTRDTGVTLDVNTWYRFFIRVDDADGQTKISARLWKDGSSEPAAFQIEAEDDSAQRLTKGRIGLWTAVKGDSYIDEILAKSPIDHSGPAIRFLRRTTAGDVDLATGFETNADVTPIIVVTDDTDRNPTVTATLDGASFNSGTAVTTEGTHVIVVHATDSLGNQSDGTVSFYVDKTAPTVVVFEGTDPLSVVNEGRVFDRDISLNLQIDDLSSATVVATLDGQPFAPGTALAPAPLYGVEKHPHELVATVRDRVGNETAVGPLRFTIDKTAPEVSITRDGAPFSGGGFNTAIALNAAVEDLTPAPLTMTLNGQPYAPGTSISANRQHTVTASATDLAGHTTTSTITFVVNQNAPGVRILENGEALPEGKYFKRPVNPTIEIDNSIPPSVQVTLDGSPWPVTLESASGNIYLYSNSNGAISADGAHTIAVVASDAAGNTTPASVTFTIDQVAPSLTILESGAPLADGAILGRDATVTAEATDAIGPVTTTLEVDGLPFTSGNAITVSGVYTVSATASDKAGNATAAGPLRLTIDKLAPEVSLLESGEEFPVDHWFNRDVVPSIAISDLTAVTVVVTIDGAVAAFTRSSVDGMSSTWSGPTVSTEGEHTIGVTVTDQVGLETALPPLHFWIDKTPPAITLATPKPASVVVAVTVTLSGEADDAVSVTVGGVPATIDATAKRWSLAAVSLLEGTNTLAITGTDRAGNASIITPSLILDTRGPALQVLSPANGSCTNASSLVVRGTASDARLASVTVAVDAQAPIAAQLDLGAGTWSVSLPGIAEGLHQISVTSADSAGHTSTAALAVRVDRTPPVIEITEGGAPFALSKVNRAVSLFVRAVDADPSVALTSTLDSGSFVSGSVIGGEGSHTLVVSARDCAGNEQQKTVSFSIDLTAPVFTAINPTNGSTVGTMPSSVAGTVTSDATSVRLLSAGAPAIEAAVSNGNFSLPGVPFGEGTNRFTLYAADDAGNESSVDYTVTVRTAVPTVEITETGTPIAPNALFNRAVTPEVRSNDAEATITATLDGASYSIGSAITTDGSHTLSATATDDLGHVGTKSVTFAIDRTAPAVAITAPSAGASIASDIVTVTGTAGDATSVTVNGAAATLSGSSFSAAVPLELGENVIVAVGRDEAGNAGRAEVTVTRAGAGPAIVLLYPADKSLTNRPKTEVRGRVITPANVESVTIAVVAAHPDAPPFSTIVTPDAAGDFRAALDLVEGRNAISATSLGKDGKSASATIEVTADFTAPLLRLRANGDELREGAQFASSAQLALDVSDAQTASPDVALSIDGTASVAPVTITVEGGHVALATARDAAGNVARVERSFSIGAGAGTPAGCSVTQLDPKAGSIVSSLSTRLAGRTSAPGVKVGGVLGDVVDGSFCVSVELPAEGANSIEIVCVDASGNPIGTAVTHTLQRVTGAPSVAITSPAEGASIDKNASGTISVSGTVGPGVVAVTVNGVRKALDTGIDTQRDFTVDGIRLTAGLNMIAARAETSSLRAATVTRRVVYLADEPSISITSPVGTVVTGASTIDVSGTWANLDPATLGPGVSIRSFGDSTGSFLLPGVPLTAGANTITISGSNAAGRPASASIVVTRTAGTPSVAISEPADNGYVAGDSVVVRGTAEAAVGSTVQVNGVAANATAEALGDGRVRIGFEATVSVSASGAITPIVARVSEPAGGGGFDTIRVTRFSGAFAIRKDDELTPLVFPAPNAVQVPATVQTLVAFTHAVDKASVVSGGVTLVAANGQPVSGVTRVDRDVVSFAPSVPLADGTTYTIKVAPTVRDLSGTELGASYESSFVTAISAPQTAPQVTGVPAAVCGTTLGIDGTAVPNARVQLDSGSWQFFATASATGAFHFDLPLTGQSGYQLVRVRTVGSDGSLSPAADVCVRVDCGGVRVVSATYDTTANAIAILFSGAIDGATLGVGSSITLTGATGAAIGGVVSLTTPATATVTPVRSLADETFTLGVTTAVRDASGNALTSPFSQTFFAGGGTTTGNPGDGYLTGEVFDAATGRPLPGASVAPVGPASSPAPPLAITDARGRYTIFVPEGAHTLEVSAPDYTTVWRQIIVPAGAGVVPIDVRLERRGVTKSVTSGELSLADGVSTEITKPVSLTVAAGSLTTGSSVTLTSVGAQSLAGLLPLGWSPLASAEVVATASPSGRITPSAAVIPSAARDLQNNLTSSSAASVPLTATLRFTVDATAITAAAQTLTAVRYDATRDEWSVAVAAVAITGNTATIAITTDGAYALVYPDKITGLAIPPPPTSGLPIQGVTDSCLTPNACGPLTKQSFTLDPPIVMPDQRTTATLEVNSALSTQYSALFPSGTAVQAYIDEELTLSDGSTITDPPFATDLILYRELDGAPAVATFHLAPSKRATEVFLQVGWEHIRVHPYPGRLDRGTLIGSEGGRVPGDGSVTIDIPAGATPEPVRAEVHPIADLNPFGTVSGYTIVSAFQFELSRATQPAASDLDGDGNPDPIAPVELLKSANATFALQTVETRQLILAEVLGNTSYGTVIQLASVCSVATAEKRTTTTAREGLPLDGIVREGRYLLLAANDPIAYATGLVRLGSATGPVAEDARVSTLNAQSAALGVADVTRATGLYATPVLAAAPVLRPETRTLGQGTPYTHGTAVAIDSVLSVHLVLAPQAPTVTGSTPAAGATEVSLTTSVQVVFSAAIDPTSITADSITLVNALTGASVSGATVVPQSATALVSWNLAKDSSGILIPLKPNARYTARVAPTVRATNGAPLGSTYTFSFATLTQIVSTEVHRDKIRITIPDASGVSTIVGSATAIPAGWQAVPVRRVRDFTQRYQATAATDGSFSITIGIAVGDAVSIADTIDLQLVNTAGILAGIIRLTPFVTADNRGFVARANEETTFTSADGFRVIVPAGAFDEPTLVTLTRAEKTAVADVPNLDNELRFTAGVTVDFEGELNKRIELEIPVPPGFQPQPNRDLMLGELVESVRGPRMAIADVLRIENGYFTTRFEATPAKASSRVSPSGVLTGPEAKKYLVGVSNKRALFTVVDIIVPAPSGFAFMDNLQKATDLFFSTLQSFVLPGYYLNEGRGRIAVPILLDQPFTITGVDSATGLKVFERYYPQGAPGNDIPIENPNPDLSGPFPAFASPGQLETVEIQTAEQRLRNFYLRWNGSAVSITHNPFEAGSLRVAKGLLVQAFNLENGESTAPVKVLSDGSFNLGSLAAAKGDRLLLIAGSDRVSPEAELSVVLNEQMQIDGISGEDVLAFLRERIRLRAVTSTGEFDVPGIVYDFDSGNRRIHIGVPGGNLVRGADYRLILRSDIKDAAGNRLAQGVRRTAATPLSAGGYRDVVISFRVTAPKGLLGDFDLTPSDAHPGAGLRDLAQYGNILFVSALDGGLLAYDAADPVQLASDAAPRPFAFVPGQWNDAATGELLTSGLEQHWAVAVDHHGRVFSTGFTNFFGAIRSYRVEDFLAAKTGNLCETSPRAPEHAMCRVRGTAVTSFRPGSNAQLYLGLSSQALVSDRPEATPRKLQLLIQDAEESYESLAAIKLALEDSTLATYPNGFERVSLRFTYRPDTSVPYYLTQRVTVENVTTGMRWSADVPAESSAEVTILARAEDKLKVLHNQHTYTVISQFGHGIAVFDLNALESNDAPNKPSGYKAPREQVILTRAALDQTCPPTATPPGAIVDLSLSPEAAVVPQPAANSVLSFAPDVHRGLLGVAVPLDATGGALDCIERPVRDLIVYERSSGELHPRLETIRTKFNSVGRTFNPRFQSVSYYRGFLQGIPQDYVLLAAGDLGLVAVNVNMVPGASEVTPYINDDSLAGLVWVPNGVMSVRTVPNSHLAVVVDGTGRVLLVDLAQIDERFDDRGDARPESALFPTALGALMSLSAPAGQAGVDDPRILWASEAGLVTGTLAPVFDPETGILFSGAPNAKTMRVTSAFDPRVRMLADYGDTAGLTEVTGAVPLGFDPSDALKQRIAGKPRASAAAFRFEVRLPGGVARALEESGKAAQIAVESEWIDGVTTEQTPPSYPKSHLRTTLRDGTGEQGSRSTALRLQRLIPTGSGAVETRQLEDELRYQKAFNRYLSPWIVAIGDPRATEKYKWPTSADRPAAGCASCDRPEHLKGKTESDGVYELWTNGRAITVRPDGALASNVFSGTRYAWLGEEGRLGAHFTTTRARKVRPTEVLVAAQNPPVAEGMLQETHYMHSGEVETAAIDLNAGGRAGVDVVVARTYRSRTLGGTAIGEGWDSSILRFLLERPNGDVEYHDGAGEIWVFDGTSSGYVSPKGLFLKLIRSQFGWSMFDQQWRIANFDDLGRLTSESDEFFDPAKPGSGNTIRYLYDETGRLQRIVDPLGRETTLSYWSDTNWDDPCTLPSPAASGSCGYPGRLREVKAEWRRRSAVYQYDIYGRLTAVNLPEVPNSAVPAYSFTGANRPTTQYSYQEVSAPPADAPLQSQPYTDFAEFSGNLTGIKDPEQVRAGLIAPKRVTFAYDLSTSAATRDRNLSQKWATGEEAIFTATENADVLGQRRTYDVQLALDGRKHILAKTVHDVPVVRLAETDLPNAVGVSENPVSQSITTTVTYDDQGMQGTITNASTGLTVINTWRKPSAGAPGVVLQQSVEAGLGVYRETVYQRDSADNATATVAGVGRRSTPGGALTSRDHQRPSRNRRDVATVQEGVTSTARYDERAQVSSVESSDGGAVAMSTHIDYYEESDANPIQSGRPKRIYRGGGEVSMSSSYSLSGLGEEKEVTRDDLVGTVTTILRDVEGRMIARKVAAPEVSAGGVSSAALTEETFAYNADGQLAYNSRTQTGVGLVVTTYKYDALARQTLVETTGANVFDTAAGTAAPASVKKSTTFDLGARRITESDPFTTTAASVPRTALTWDALGRVTKSRRESTDGALFMESVRLYDVHGTPAYESDGSRAASLTRNDALGRAVGVLLSDGTRMIALYNEWDELIETRGFAKKVGTESPELTSLTRNLITPRGKPAGVTEQVDLSGRSRGTRFTWDAGETINASRTGELATLDSEFESTSKLRVQQQILDAAGRLAREAAGEAEGLEALASGASVYAEHIVTDYVGDEARAHEMREPRAAALVRSQTVYDGLGNAILTREGGVHDTEMTYDEAGNVLTSKAPGMPATTIHYDSRGLPIVQELPEGVTIRQMFDVVGNVRRYTDEEGNTTEYETDGLGRVHLVRYPDATTEEVRYENGTGVVLARRDRAKQWISFKYDPAGGRLIEEHDGGTGVEPDTAASPITRYAYDDAGRLTKVTSADAAVEYRDFDLLGRPRETRTIRFKKSPCATSTVGCGTGLTTAEILDVHTQGHAWSVFDGERSRWRMPAAGAGLPPGETASPWRSWIVETRDAAGNLVRQQEAASLTAAAGEEIARSQARGVARLAERTRPAGSSSIATRYGYAEETDGAAAPVVPTLGSAPGAPAGFLGRAETSLGGIMLAGSEVTRDEAKRIGSSTDLGLGGRSSSWDYDVERGWLSEATLLGETGSVTAARSEHLVRDAGFLETRDMTPRLLPADFSLLGSDADEIEPLTWRAADPTNAHQITSRQLLFGASLVETESFVFTGARRTTSGAWTIEYDARGRVVAQQSALDARRIVYDYDPNDRLAGRTAYQQVAGGTWSLETRSGVLARDGLPAAATFVWDPVTDRLVAIYEAGASVGAASPDAGLVRQYVHGDQDYDDPVEVLVATAGGVARYLPVIDEAGTGSLQAIVTSDGTLAERVLYADAYGDAPRYLHGAVALSIDAKRSGTTREVRVELSDAIDGATAAVGARLTAIRADGTSAALTGIVPTVEGARSLVWAIDEAAWSAFVANATSIDVEVGAELRFPAWGATPVQAASPWEVRLGKLATSDAWPVAKRVAVAYLDEQLGVGAFGAGSVRLYEAPDLYLVARPESKTQLGFDFHGLPFREPASGFVYARARWYDPSTGSFLTPDPAGYRDSSNLYAFAGNDPVNFRDPTGEWRWWDENIDALDEEGWKEFRKFLSGSAGALPVLGEITDGIQAITGYDFIEGRDLTRTEQAIAAAAFFIPFGGASAARQLGEEVMEGGTKLALRSMPTSAVKEASHLVEAVTDVKPKFSVGEMRELVRRQEAKGFSKAEAMERIRRGEACFLAGTPVATATGLRPIEEIVSGLEVTSRDMETGKVEYKPVVQLFRREVDAIVYIGVAGEPEPIGATTEHPFWTRRARDAIDASDDGEGWVAAGELRGGDLLQRSSGEWVAVTSVERRAERRTVYNFEVQANHTYFVGTVAVLVHNRCGLGQTGEEMVIADLTARGHTDIVAIQNNSGHGIDIVARDRRERLRAFEVKATETGKRGRLSKPQRNPDEFVRSRLEAAVAGEGAWQSASKEVRESAARILEKLDSGEPIAKFKVDVRFPRKSQQGPPTLEYRRWKKR